MKYIRSLIIIIIAAGLSAPGVVLSKVLLKCDQIGGKWAPIYVNCHKVKDTAASKVMKSTAIQPVYFTPKELIYQNMSYGNFPIKPDLSSSTNEKRAPASVSQPE